MHGSIARDIAARRVIVPEPAAARESAAPASLLRFITCGSVDDGKSTFIGRLLYDCHAVHDDQLVSLEKDSRRYGTQGSDLDFALLVDGLSAEREQGITIDVAYRYFSTAKRSFIVADTPGHEQYTRNMATGASTADVAVILIDGRQGPTAQTKRHAFIVALLGIRHVVVAVNKMDLLDHSQARFEAVAAEFKTLAATLGFASIVSIPISAKHGDNVCSRSAAMAWYRGPHLLEYLEIVDVEEAAADVAFRFPVQWVSRPNPEFRGYCGSIASGTVAPGAPVTVYPSGRQSTVKEIFVADRVLVRAGAGQSVTLTLADDVDVSRGDVIVSGHQAVEVTRRISAHLLWMSDTALKLGDSYLIKLGTKTTTARVLALHHTIDVFDYARRAAGEVGSNDLASVTIAFDVPLALTSYRDCRDLGGFALFDRFTNETVALGLAATGEGAVPMSAQPEPAVLSRWTRSGFATRILGWLWQAQEKPLRSIAKAITWRTTGSIDTFVLTFIFTGSAKISAAVSLSEIGTKLALYYAHERIWARSRFGLRATAATARSAG